MQKILIVEEQKYLSNYLHLKLLQHRKVLLNLIKKNKNILKINILKVITHTYQKKYTISLKAANCQNLILKTVWLRFLIMSFD
ncbi:unnamed protein product [Paramecium pentaurelia]|uniref:Uncharacterized protein n=1 Tax=Paramecium pentaurelia TaxID=43138 RepID=A0A8S1UM30_9CILI|nr:unnamed protein product [Paramecium pentaurelia]